MRQTVLFQLDNLKRPQKLYYTTETMVRLSITYINYLQAGLHYLYIPYNFMNLTYTTRQLHKYQTGLILVHDCICILTGSPG